MNNVKGYCALCGGLSFMDEVGTCGGCNYAVLAALENSKKMWTFSVKLSNGGSITNSPSNNELRFATQNGAEFILKNAAASNVKQMTPKGLRMYAVASESGTFSLTVSYKCNLRSTKKLREIPNKTRGVDTSLMMNIEDKTFRIFTEKLLIDERNRFILYCLRILPNDPNQPVCTCSACVSNRLKN